MATLATNVSFQCFGLDGKPLAGGKVYSYAAGTTTNKATYTTMAGTVTNPNPITLDQNGKAKIFLGDGAYRLRIFDKNGAMIDDIDQISRYVTQSEFASFQQTVNDGVAQLTEVREQIDVYVNASIGDQKGYANGITPLNGNVKVDQIYLPQGTSLIAGILQLVNSLTTGGTDKAATAEMVKTLNNTKLESSVAFGINQTYQDVTSSRVLGTTYTNTTNKDIWVSVSVSLNAGATLSAIVNGQQVCNGFAQQSSSQAWAGLLVPPNGTYSVSGSGIIKWMERK